MKVSAYIPCFNNRDTIGRAIASIRAQSRPVDEFFMVDDGSSDGSAEVAASLGVRVISQSRNKGRGAARCLAMAEAAHELVLCCDAAKTLEPDFAKNAIPWFEDQKVAAVYGSITQPPAINATDRWNARHLLKTAPETVQRGASLATYGAMIRASAARDAGGFNANLRMAEDADLGVRLLAAGHDVVCDPKLKAVSISPDTLAQALERYWRWNTAPYGRMNLVDYLRQIVFSIRVMARADWRERDRAAALISLLSPHYQFWVPLVTRKR